MYDVIWRMSWRIKFRPIVGYIKRAGKVNIAKISIVRLRKTEEKICYAETTSVSLKTFRQILFSKISFHFPNFSNYYKRANEKSKRK